MATSKSTKKPKNVKPATKSASKSKAKPAAAKPAVSVAANKKRQLKATPVSLREQASLAAKKPAKRSKRSQLFRVISWPFVKLYLVVQIVLRPFAFVLIPFRTRPARAIGRFLASVLFFRYFRNSWKELRQVQWPNARETTKMTLAVFAFAVFFSLIVSLADWAINGVVEKLIIN